MDPNATTLAQELSSSPSPGQTRVTASIGGQIQNGRTETKSLGTTGMVGHTTMKEQVFRFDVTTVRAEYRAAEHQPFITVEDNQLATFTYIQPHGKRVRLIGMGGWRRDTILKLDYYGWGEAGAGVLVFAKGNANMFVGGSYSAGQERRHGKDASFVMDVGGLETFNFRVNKLMTFEQWFKAHKDVTDTGNDNYTFNATFLTKVTKWAGMKVSYNLQHDELHPPTASATQSQFSIGLQVTFASTPKKAAAPEKKP